MHGNGGGFDTQYMQELFGGVPSPAFPSGLERTGVGLALRQRVAGRHGGRVWAT
jgi:light-regulated signal transduction histidine kinase (bacteriophytochrome)